MRATLFCLIVTLTLSACAPQTAGAPGRRTVRLEPLFRGLEQPTDMRFSPDGGALVSEQRGRVVLLGAGRPETVLDLRDATGCCGERGLLSLALHPDFARNGLLFLYGSDGSSAGHTVLSRVRLEVRTRRADLSSYRTLLTIPQPGPTHNGGQLQFGPDGYLYLSVGEGLYLPSWLGTLPFAQQHNSLLGKLLRFGVGADGAISVPQDNPFVGRADAKGAIWALGLRNPWRFSFDRLTGDLFLADVGETAFEEIDALPLAASRGANYGWPLAEGPACRRAAGCAAFVSPALSYPHTLGCSVTGGYVYRGSRLPGLDGDYLYGDFCSGSIWAAERRAKGWRSRLLLDTPLTLSSFAQDGAGELYVLDYSSGTVFALLSAR